jgi:flagellar assembly protein FliH
MQQPILPELEDPFLQSLVWDEEAVSSGMAPDRRGTPRPIRRQEDTHLLAEAKTEAEYIKEQAREAGFQEGLRQAQQTIESVWVLLDDLQTAHQQALLNSVEQIVPIAIEIAEKIIKTEVACDKTLLIALAKDLLTKVDRTQKQVIFKVNPSDASFFRAEVEQSPVWRSNEREIVVEEDATVAQGSCVLETAGGQIDANFNTQLKTVRKLLGLPEKAPNADNPLPALDDDDDANWGFRS